MDWKVLAARPTEAKWSSPRSLWEGGHGERRQGPTEQEMWPFPSPTPTLVMNVGPAIPGEDPGGADE